MNEVKNLPDMEGFTRDQIDEIQEGIKEQLDVSVYARKEFLAIQMRQIRLGLKNGIPVEKYARVDYDWFQMEEIRKGLEEGIDISVYAAPDISYDRMHQIRLGLIDNINLASYKALDAGILQQLRLALQRHINIVPYIVNGYNANQLEAIREALEKGIDVKEYVRKEYMGIALREIFIGLENGLDVSPYADVKYNWQQMREIRLGLEHMVDVEQYRNVYYSHRQMKELRLGLEDGLDISYYKSLMYTAVEMHERRIYLEAHPTIVLENEIKKLQAELKAKNEPVGNGQYDITVSPNEMEAYIEVHGVAKNLDKIDIVKALNQKGICYGIKYDVIDEIVSGNCPRKPLLIAAGKETVEGKNGWYEFFFRTHVARTHKQLDDGNIDYRDVEWFETVEKGQKLAYYHNSQRGENGITVRGKTIPAKRGKEKSILTGKGFKRLADGKTYVSELDGIVTLQDFLLNVSELLVMQEVNMATGDVEYEGNVLVEGNVTSGSKIRATKDVIVKGFVEGAQITSGGNVFLRQGMNGSGGGFVCADNNVIGCFFEGVDVRAGGDIQGDYFFKCSLNAVGSVKAIGKKGTIAGGSICAEKGIKAVNLGNPAGLPTYVRLENFQHIRNKENKINADIASVNQELFVLQNAHRDFQRKYAPEIRNTMDIYLKIESAIYTKEKQMEGLLNEKVCLQDEIKKSGNAKVSVEGQLYEGVEVEIDGARWQAKSVKGVTLKKLDKGIAVFSNYVN